MGLRLTLYYYFFKRAISFVSNPYECIDFFSVGACGVGYIGAGGGDDDSQR